ncbi:TIGR03085 family metal-binding protein [Actinotalea sp. Marseille-Q4924]|uniref:TIGR03085 family metal-binding protein n=1 Tax=Actinotalea sp. Marseille-Q4924 TaxID=2866571 RepID=UPI001CE44CD8|nr:TIGR03085 family metal-binding protein [Actinotalea sp. Marseille-Q4924]
MSWHPLERAAVVAALREAGPGAPTLCDGWRTEQLAAHLVLRERDPLTAAGVVVPPLAARTERRTQEVGARAATPAAWEALLHRLAEGPPVWSPLRWAGDPAQLAEYFVHTEDVRRGGADGRAVPGRPREARHTAALWTALRRMAPLLLGRAPVPVVLTDGDQVLRAGPRGDAPATVHGDVGELLLWAYERPAVAHVEVTGSPEQLAALEAFRPQSS